ncbi:MAG: ATP-binding cassette domain-containing protein [Gammaproteobacteria bacterium]
MSLQIRTGSLFGLLGPNGSGKTTLISILTGLLPAASGQVWIDGQPLPKEVRTVQAVSALVPQEYAFYPRLSVLENLRFFAAALAIPADDLPTRLNGALQATGLRDFRTKRAEHLSGGLKRRLNLAIGLLNRRVFCSWMSRPWVLIRNRGISFWKPSNTSMPRAPPWCTPRITWKKLKCFVMKSAYWIKDDCWPTAR